MRENGEKWVGRGGKKGGVEVVVMTLAGNILGRKRCGR